MQPVVHLVDDPGDPVDRIGPDRVEKGVSGLQSSVDHQATSSRVESRGRRGQP